MSSARFKKSKQCTGLVAGVGVNDFEGNVWENGKHIYEYKLWGDMLRRCYSEIRHKRQPTYIGCEVEDDLLSFTNFYNFVNSSVGFGKKDDNGHPFQMDKDILSGNNKHYTRDFICFVPREINNFFVKSNKISSQLPTGVYLRKSSGRYHTKITVSGKAKHLGFYSTPEEAFLVYKEAKENRAKELAEKWKNDVDHRIYDCLMNYEVSSNELRS